jgi:outer membrane receptor protein involved in Fe transport
MGIASAADTSQTSSSSAEELQEVVITGTHLQMSGFTTPTPVTVIGQDFLEERSPTDANDIMKEIPSLRLSNGATATGGIQASSVSQQYVNLYGLSSLRTLTLIDGYRQAADTLTGQVDVNTIPTFLIDRIELVTGGASAAYGSDALAGVANFVLKDKLDGGYFGTSYGEAQHDRDRQTTSLDLGYGRDIFGGRGNFLVGAELTRDTGIDTWYDRSFGQQEPGLFATGSAIVGGGGSRAGLPAAVWENGYEYSSNTPASIITGCAPITANCSGIAGTSFTRSGVPYAFPYGTHVGSFMYGSTANYGDNPDSFFNLSSPYKRWTGLAKLTFDVTDDIKLRVKVGYSGTSGDGEVGVSQTTVNVSASNPYLPASIGNAMAAAGVTSITVGRTNTDLGPIMGGQVDRAVNAVVDLSGKLGGNWHWDVYAAPSQTTQSGWETGQRTSDIDSAFSAVTVDGVAQCGTLSATQVKTTGPASAGCVPFNIFGSGQASPAAYAYLNQYMQEFKVDSKEKMAEGSVSGTPFSDWAGPLSLAAGVDYRRDEIDRIPLGDSALLAAGTAGFYAGNFLPLSSSREVREAYAETEIPLLRAVPFAKALDFNAAYRYMDYSDQGSYNAWKAGMTWDINDEYRWRVTRSRDIRAPTLFQQYGSGTLGLQSVINPVNNQTNIAYYHSVPSTVVRAETSYTTTTGFVIHPHWAPGLQISVDYFDIKIGGVIAALTAQQMVTGCLADHVAVDCPYVTLANGAVTLINAPDFNLNGLEDSGFDIEASYLLPVRVVGGQVTLHASGTNIEHYKLTSGGVVTEEAGYYSEPAAAGPGPRWNTNFMAVWQRGPFSSSAEVLYFSNLKYSTTSFGPDSSQYYQTVTSTKCPGGTVAVPTSCANYLVSPNSISRNIFPGMAYLNWSAQYEFKTPLFKKLQIYLDINNLLDTPPPAYAAAAFNASSLYDVIGRNFKLGVRGSF